VVCLTLAGNYALDGLNVRGYHAFNLAVHLLSALVLFGIARRTLEEGSFRDRLGAAAVWLAGAIALIWEVHPLQTESVTYIIQPTELLMGLFLLLTLYCTLRGARSDRPRPWYLLAVVFCALGMGCKQVMVSAPLIVLLYDRVFLASSFRELWQKRAGLYLGLAATWLLLGLLVAVLVAGTPHRATGFAIRNLTPWNYLMTEAGVILYYLQLCFWPRPLVIDYFDWPIASSLDDVLLPVIAILGLLGTTVWAFRRRPWLGFLGAWFFLILAPTSSFLPTAGEVAAERRMYLPLAAVVAITVIGAFELGKRLFNKRHGVVLGCLAVASVVVLFTFLTIQRNQDYKSDVIILQDTVNKRPNNARAHTNLGIALAETGRLNEAIAQCEAAVQLKPNNAIPLSNLGSALLLAGRARDAIAEYNLALRIQPGNAAIHNHMAKALLQSGNVRGAIEEGQRALQLNPELAEAHKNLADALLRAGRVAEAIDHYQRAIQLKPDYVEAHYHLATTLEEMGRPVDAIKQYEEALRTAPDFAITQNNLAWLLATLDPPNADPARAVALAERACQSTGYQAAPYLDTLAVAYAAAGRFTDAIATAQKAIDLARSAGQTRIVAQIESRLELYRHGRAYRQSAGAANPAGR